MTPTQQHHYALLSDFGWEYDYTEYNGDIFMTRWDRSIHDTSSRLATMVVPVTGEPYLMPTLTQQR